LSVEQYLKKLSGLGIKVDRWQVINSSQATAYYLQQRFPEGGPVYILGENGLEVALQDFGFYHQEDEVLSVIVSLDRKLTYSKLVQATLLIRSGIDFIGTNPDPTFPTPQGLVPGTGSILALLESASEVEPVIIGKPAPEMYRVALQRLGASAHETLVVGDRLETDISGAQALGCRCALVLSGVSSIQEAENWKPELDIVAPNLSSLLDFI
jgi:4-nitrophenyl phosphatase